MSKINFSTIDSPSIINLKPTDVSPLMSSCQIKVLYIGENRNHSYISKEVALEMSKSLRGCPIVGYYRTDKEDFADHGERITIDDQGIHFDCMTKPYGFIAPDAKVWFQKYQETNSFGETIEREYLVTEGFVWSTQFPEVKAALEEGRPHSMEIDEATLNGSWETNTAGIEFFVITDALFSKLCILGEDVEPCFEGSSISQVDSPESKFIFADESFKNTLYSMMKDLKKYTLKKGGAAMDAEKELKEKENPSIDFEKKEETSSKEKENEKSKEDEETKKENDENKNKEKEYSLLKEQYKALNNKYSELQQQYNLLEQKNKTLESFKLEIENDKKDKLINSFYMLSDEDKKEIVENKSKFSYDEIEAKLSVLCFRKKVNFSEKEKEENPITTFSLEEQKENEVPAFIQALRKTKSKMI